MYDYMKDKLSQVANEFGERVLETPMNQISLGNRNNHIFGNTIIILIIFLV